MLKYYYHLLYRKQRSPLIIHSLCGIHNKITDCELVSAVSFVIQIVCAVHVCNTYEYFRFKCKKKNNK